jgi:ABC-type polysaccharide transport system permease subunit
MVHPALTHTVNVVHIIFFVFLNILYGYVVIKVRKTKMDRTAKLILVLNYLVYLREFVSSVIDNVDGLVFSMFNITCYIILQLATIIILSEAERVKLIQTTKTSAEYVAGVKKVRTVK